MSGKRTEARRLYERDWARRWRAKNPELSRERNHASYYKNVEKHRACARAWYYANKARAKANSRASYIRCKYGLTREEFAALDQRCAICGATEMVTRKGRRYSLHVDHCHDSSKVRGMLCHHCNTGIGGLRHDVALLQKAIAYLQRTEEGK